MHEPHISQERANTGQKWSCGLEWSPDIPIKGEKLESWRNSSRVPVAFSENRSSAPNIHIRWLITTCNSSSKGSDTLLASKTPAHMCHTHTYEIKEK